MIFLLPANQGCNTTLSSRVNVSNVLDGATCADDARIKSGAKCATTMVTYLELALRVAALPRFSIGNPQLL
jgi:hypothetical protein